MAKEDLGLTDRPADRLPALRLAKAMLSNRQTMSQAARFAMTGIAAAAVHTLALYLLVEVAGLRAVPANGLAFLCAVCVTWVGQSLWAFRGAAPDPTRLPRFLVTVVSGFLANLLLMWLAVDVLGAGWPVGLLLVISIVPPATFLLAKFWVFEAAGPK